MPSESFDNINRQKYIVVQVGYDNIYYLNNEFGTTTDVMSLNAKQNFLVLNVES